MPACAHVPRGAHAPVPHAAIRQTCVARHAQGAELALELTLSPVQNLVGHCQRIADFLALPQGPLPPFATGEAEQALLSLGYFSDASCELESPARMRCELGSTAMVRRYRIRGHLPLALLQEDLRRRMALRPGTLLPDIDAALRTQAARLEGYLRGEGYFDAIVAIEPREVPSGGLNQGIELEVAVSAHTSAQVRHIELRGDVVLPEEVLLRPFWQRGPLGLPGRFRPAHLGQSIDAATELLREQGYIGAHVQASYTHHPEAHAIDLTVRVVAGRRVQVDFRGEGPVSRRRLLRLAPFVDTGAVDAVAVEAYRGAIVRLYQERGHAEVDVQAAIGRSATHALEVRFDIVPGPRQFVERISWRGALHNATASLVHDGALMQRASTRWRRRFWVDELVAHDEAHLEAALRERGLPDARVRAHKLPGAQNGALVLEYEVDAGRSRRVRSVRIEGAPPELDVAATLARLRLQAGGPLAQGGLDGDVQELAGALASAGYIEAGVTPTLSWDGGEPVHTELALLEQTGAPRPEPRPGAEASASGAAAASAVVPIDVVYTLAPGYQAHLGNIFTRGNFRTRNRTLFAELGMRPGTPLNLTALGEARRRLRALNLFNVVQLRPVQSNLGAGETWLVLGVEERQSLALDGVAAFSSDFGFSLGADWRDANWLGRAMALSVHARLANAAAYGSPWLRIGAQDKIEAKLRAPRPFGLPLQAEAGVSYRYVDVVAYRERGLVGQAAVSRPLLQRRACRLCPDVMGRLAYEIAETYLADKQPNGDVLGDPEQTLARFVPSVSFSRRDSPIDPRRGAALDVRLDVAHPGLAGGLGHSASAFLRLIVGTQAFVPLGVPLRVPLGRHHTFGGPLVLALASGYSHARPYGPRGGVPASETFGYGGDLSVRALVNRASTAQLAHARAMVTASAELRWYVLENFGFGTVQLAGFVDLGTVARRPRGLLAERTISVGPALRYVTPIGPLSLAYGRALQLPQQLRDDPTAAPRHGRLHFTFGYTF